MVLAGGWRHGGVDQAPPLAHRLGRLREVFGASSSPGRSEIGEVECAKVLGRPTRRFWISLGDCAEIMASDSLFLDLSKGYRGDYGVPFAILGFHLGGLVRFSFSFPYSFPFSFPFGFPFSFSV